MQDSWLSVYGAKSSRGIPILSTDVSTLVTDKDDILERWTEHFNSVLNLPPSVHDENTPMQYTVIFHSCKNNNFQMKNCDTFLILAQNIDFGNTLEQPH